MREYLESSTYIDWQHPVVRSTAMQLAEQGDDPSSVIRRSFEFVRDEIRHCMDVGDERMTAKASEVLAEGTGFCYAKSHLLAALLRANAIPAALCYQRLEDEGGFSLHGLNAVYLDEIGWYRLDPRGNKAGIDARFMPPVERLAYDAEDALLPGYWAAPAPSIVRVLTRYDRVSEARLNLPQNLEGSV